MNFSIFFKVFSGILSLSKLKSVLTKFESDSSFFTDAQEGSFYNSIMTALITISTSGGGLANDFTSTIERLSRL